MNWKIEEKHKKIKPGRQQKERNIDNQEEEWKNGMKQRTNNNLTYKKHTEVTKRTENWETPKRRYEIKP